ncbi:hypothetical protein V8E53_013894 [Lactarius tabidus]
MALDRPGRFTVSCRACLENPRVIGDEGKFGEVDALIFTSKVVNHTSMVACSLRFCRSDGALRDGVYDISANVVAYRHEAVTDNVVDGNENVKLMGDILDVRTFFNILARMKPQNTFNLNRSLSLRKIPSLHAKSLQEFPGLQWFLQSTKSITALRSFPRNISTLAPRWKVSRCELSWKKVRNGQILSRDSHLPAASLRSQNPGPIRSDLGSRIVVALDSIIYLRANYGSTELSNPPPSLHSQDADSVALKTRILKYSQSTTDSTLSQEDEDGED